MRIMVLCESLKYTQASSTGTYVRQAPGQDMMQQQV